MKSKDIREDTIIQVASIVSQVSGLHPQTVYEHALEPLNGVFFRFDAVSMIHFVLTLKRVFRINLNNQMLKSCAYWNVTDFAQWIIMNLSKHTS